MEAPLGSDFTSTPAEAYGLTRIRLGLAFRPVKWLRLFAEAEDSRVEFYQVTPPSTLSDPFDLHQAYVEVGAIEGDGVKVRAGRQELFGSEQESVRPPGFIGFPGFWADGLTRFLDPGSESSPNVHRPFSPLLY